MARSIPYADADIDAYARYVARLAAIAAPNDPATPSFRIWFYWRHGAMPLETARESRAPHPAQNPDPAVAGARPAD